MLLSIYCVCVFYLTCPTVLLLLPLLLLTHHHPPLSLSYRLHSKLEALDFEVERAAEEELFQNSLAGDSAAGPGSSNVGSYEDDYD